MQEPSKTNQELFGEIALLKQRIQELEISKVECKQENDALRESEEIYRILLSESPDPTFSFTPEGQYRYVNRAFAEGVGKPVEDIIGKSIWDIFPKDEADKRFASLSQVFRTGDEKVIEVRVPCVDGDRYYMTTITPIKDAKGKILSAICSSKDITDRKRVEEALHSSETKFRTLFNSTSDAVMLLDEKNFLDCNKATLAIFGCATRKEFCKKHPAELSPSQQPCGTDSIVLANRMIAEAMGKGSIHFEWMHKRNDTGETFTADVLLTAMELDGKRIVQAVVRDITERKQAEEKSQNMLILLQILINTIPSPIFRKDINGRYQGCNKEFENYTGFRREDIIGKSVHDLYPKDVADKYHEMDLALFREPGRQIYEYPIIYADGERHDVVVNKATYFNADGTLGGIVGVMVDITERKQAEFKREAALKELRESEAKFRLLFNSGKDYVAVHLMGKDGQPMNFVQVNDAACEKLGYTREEMLNLSPQDIDAADSSERMPELIKKLFGNKQVLFETEMLSKNGHRIPMEVSVNLFQLDDNQATMCVARDITERKQVEQDLANRLIFQQTLIDTIPHPIFFKNEVGRFVGCNRAYEREFGITRDYMIGKTVLDLEYLPIDERQRFQDEDMMVIREAGRKSYEMPIVYADDQTHMTLYSVDGFTLADGNPGGLIGMLVDISERKKAEDELAKYREGLEKMVEERTRELEGKTKTLEEVNIALKVLLQHREEDKKELEDRFVMNVNNLIIPFAEKMKNTNLDERQLAYLDIIETHLKDITSSMIKKFNQLNLTPTEVEVAALIKEGKATKEIAKIMGTAASSIDTHRNNIRKKLGISMKNVNLRSHLQSFN